MKSKSSNKPSLSYQSAVNNSLKNKPRSTPQFLFGSSAKEFISLVRSSENFLFKTGAVAMKMFKSPLSLYSIFKSNGNVIVIITFFEEVTETVTNYF